MIYMITFKDALILAGNSKINFTTSITLSKKGKKGYRLAELKEHNSQKYMQALC